MANQKSNENGGLVAGSLVDIIAGKYQGHNGSIVRFTPKRIVIRLAKPKTNWATPTRNKEITIPPGSVSIRRVDDAFSITNDANGGLIVGSLVDIIAGKYQGHNGSIVRFTPKRIVIRLAKPTTKWVTPTRNKEITIPPGSVSIRRVVGDGSSSTNDPVAKKDYDAIKKLELIAQLVVMKVSLHHDPTAALNHVLQSVKELDDIN
jgi:ribosomal protein L24